ncbi:MAG: dioxygenase, partial [Spirochaetales bacterium]|nr:dioxygenase [Spirochaetales bacterium]
DMSGNEIRDPLNNEFQDWLIKICCKTDDQGLQEKELIGWKTAPSATYCHPREEHLLPLHVCNGLAGASAELIFDDYIAGKRAIGLLW